MGSEANLSSMLELFEWIGSLGILISILVYGQRMVVVAAITGLIANLFLGIVAVKMNLNGILFMCISSSGIHMFNIADRIRKNHGEVNLGNKKEGGGITPL